MLTVPMHAYGIKDSAPRFVRGSRRAACSMLMLTPAVGGEPELPALVKCSVVEPAVRVGGCDGGGCDGGGRGGGRGGGGVCVCVFRGGGRYTPE